MGNIAEGPSAQWWFRSPAAVLLGLTLSGLAAGGLLHLVGIGAAGVAVWVTIGALGAAYSLFSIVTGLRAGGVAVDVIALLAVVGAMAVGEELAAAVIAVMLTSGRSLEDWSAGRAARELRALLERRPDRAHRYGDEGLEVVEVDVVSVGDRLMVAAGEVIPVDGTLRSARAVIDESALTGEALPAERSGVAAETGPGFGGSIACRGRKRPCHAASSCQVRPIWSYDASRRDVTLDSIHMRAAAR